MALQQPYDFKGINLPDAYYRLTALALAPTRQECAFELSIYANRQARLDGVDPLDSESILCAGEDYAAFFSEAVLKEDGKSGISQAYAYAATLPVFSGAVSV